MLSLTEWLIYKRLKKQYTIYTVFIVIILLAITSGCDKKEETDAWSTCYSCTIDSWTGDFSGTTNYFDAQSNSTVEGLEISIEFEETGTDYLTAYVVVPNYYSASISGELSSTYSISFSGTSSSITATIYSKDNEIRINGNSKRYHFKVDSVVIDEVINFEAYKVLN